MGVMESLNELFDFVDSIDKDHLFNAILAFITLMFVWENYLSYRQFMVQKKNTKVPAELTNVIDQTTFDKSRLYAIDKDIYSFIHGLYGQIESYLILYLGFIPFVWRLSHSQLQGFQSEWLKSEIATSVLFIIYFMVFSKITSLPWTVYHTFVLEEKHGFNKQTGSFFFKDTIKQFIVSLALTVPIVALLIYIVRIGGDYFFLYAWLFITVISLLIVTIYADYIAPLFDKYTPMPEGELRQQIEALAKSMNFPLYKLYVVEGSKRSAHSNAYLYGFHKSKRIVLFDTLIEGYKPADATDPAAPSTDTPVVATAEPSTGDKKATDAISGETKAKGCNNAEILAVLAHELGHWKLSHNLKNLFITEINLFFYFLIFAVLMNRHVFYAAFGFDNEKPVLIGLIVILQFIFAPYNELVSFFMTALCRRFEFQADAFAKSLHKAELLKSALVKLHKDNLSFPVCDWLYSTWHYSHPPLIERMKALDDQPNTKKSD